MKKSLLFTAGLTLAVLPVSAQKLGAGYVTWPESQSLHTYVSQWNGGNGTLTVDGKTWEDANFFISRVKPKERFYDATTQVYPGITQYDATTGSGTDKRVSFWVPIGEEARNNFKLNALPDGVFDGEVFNMWAYIDHWGNWNSPFGWTPGNFADVAHKNGVAVSGVCGVPFGALGSWQTTFTSLKNLGGTTVGKFLYYFGQDGLGYNSEWGSTGGGAVGLGLTTLHEQLQTYMADKNPLWEVMWYGGVSDTGGNNFDTGLTNSGTLYKSASMFLNYNWNNTGTMSAAINTSKNTTKKSPFYIYAGMNMQGGEPKSGSNYDLIKDYQYSIGLWGAHAVNMLWQGRYSNGSSDAAKISTYLKNIEQWFGNGPRNPAIKLTPTLNRSHRPSDNWAGMSAMMTARSTLKWDLAKEPFYTFFNIGNGSFFNWKGKRTHNNPWHNIGIQDYQPTWHYWFAPTLLGGNTASGLSASDVNMHAEQTWEDAYVGGSCLKITGTTTSEYLHLFKSDFTLVADDKIVLKYKLLGGKGDVTLIGYGKVNTTATKLTERKKAVFTIANSEDVEDASYSSTEEGGWQTLTWDITAASRLADWMVTALKFENTENLELLIGGLWIEKNGVTFPTPAAPKLTSCKLLANNVSGVDAKLIWNMDNDKLAGEPCYNIDVNTSMFQLWAQQEGEEPMMMGMTTSWAGFVFAAPVNNNGTKRMRFGVSALSLDTKESSEVTWSDYKSLSDYQTIDDITINKNIIKPNEKFEIEFVDPQHSSATWTITDEAGNVKWSGSGIKVECPGLDAIGAYNLNVTSNGTTKEYPRYVAVSSEDVGALPEIYSLAINGDKVEENGEGVVIMVNDKPEFSYTGRKADGSASRGVDLNENWFGVSCGEIGLTGNKSFSVAAWVKYDELPTGRSNFITIEDRTGQKWPLNNWGYFWSRINDEGKFLYDGIDSAWGWRTETPTEGGRIFYRYDDAKIDVGAWTHVAIVFEYKPNTSEMRSTFYINGKKQMVSAWVSIVKSVMEGIVGSENGEWTNLEKCFGSAKAYGTNTYTPDYVEHNYPVSTTTWIAFGGTSKDISAVKGCVDDFQVWGKAMTEEEVRQSMEGLDKNNLPADVYGYWDFESDAASDKSFAGQVGSSAPNTAPKAYLYSMKSGGENDNTRVLEHPQYLVGSPFIAGTAFPVVTKPTWETRRAEVVGDGTGESGSATLSWPKTGDYSVRLRLANGHGEATMDYPVVKVTDSTQGIDEIGVDEQGFTTYTVDDALFVEFDADGAYNVEVYNMAGMLVGQKAVDVVAGQNVSIALGQAGVYLVKVVRDGQLMRTVKVIRK